MMSPSEQLYCDAADCNDPKNPGFPRPVFRRGKCEPHCQQIGRTGTTKPIAERKSAKERLMDLGDEWLNETEDDAREAVLWKRFIKMAKGMPDEDDTGALVERFKSEHRRRRADAARRGLEAAKARGVRIGRPPKVETDEVRRVYQLLRNVTRTALVLKLDPANVSRRLGLGRLRKAIVSQHASPSPAA